MRQKSGSVREPAEQVVKNPSGDTAAFFSRREDPCNQRLVGDFLVPRQLSSQCRLGRSVSIGARCGRGQAA